MRINRIWSILPLIVLIGSCERQTGEIIIDSSGGFVYTMGANKNGVLGDSTEIDRFTPYKIKYHSNVIDLKANSDVCMALTNTGHVYMWGRNDAGQLGIDRMTEKILYPKYVTGIPKAARIATGGPISAIVDIDGNVWIWGTVYTDDFREDSIFSSHIPLKVEGISGIVDIDCGGSFFLVLDSNGEVWAWGRNVVGCLGNGTTGTHSMIPKKVSNLTNVIKISAGGYFNLALISTGDIYSWGYNLHGELGNGDNNESYVPVKVRDINNAVDISTGYNHSLCLTNDKRIYAWGENYAGQLGDNSDESSNLPVLVSTLTTVKQINASGSSSIALTENGQFWAWGCYRYNSYPYGYGGYNTPVPTPIRCLNNAEKIACGGFHYMIIKKIPRIESTVCFEEE